MSAVAQLRIVWPDQEPQSRSPGAVRDGDKRLAWTWGEFFERWFVPGVAKPKGRASGTLDLYESTLKYWRDITGDPAIGETTDQDGIDFVGMLPEWGFTRRGVSRRGKCPIGRLTDHPSYDPLSSPTIASHADRMGTLFRHAGPRYDPRVVSAGILPMFPFIPKVTGEFETKEPFALEVARRIYAAAGKMTKPDLPAGWSHALWWQTRIALFYFTGLRAGTVVSLARKHVKRIDGELWLDVPGALVRKTGKAVKMPVHPQLADLIGQLPAAGPDEPLLPEGCCYRHFLTLHGELLGAADLTDEERQSPHGWRRTHLRELGKLGLSMAFQVARIAADHSDGRTTEDHYVGQEFVNVLRLKMPRLDV